MKEKLSGGTIWRAQHDVICENSSRKGRRVVVDKGELVEFRYPHDAHFRVREELYLYLDENVFLSNFKYVGRVFEDVRFRNQNKMAEIIDAVLYHEEN